MWEQQNSNSSSAEVYQDTVGHNCSVDFLPDAKHLNEVEKSAFSDILSEAALSHTQLLSTGTQQSIVTDK